jgi:hypothetical protein
MKLVASDAWYTVSFQLGSSLVEVLEVEYDPFRNMFLNTTTWYAARVNNFSTVFFCLTRSDCLFDNS